MAVIVLVQPKTSLLDLGKDAPAMPLSLLYAASKVAEQFPVALYDQRIDGDMGSWLKLTAADDILCFGITAIPGQQASCASALASWLKANSKAPIVWGGKHATLFPCELLEAALADFVVRGSGEERFYELVAALADRRAPGIVSGVLSKDHSCTTPTDHDYEPYDLEKITSLPYGMLRHRYLYTKKRKKTSVLETSRGCPYACTYCYHSAHKRPYWKGARAAWVVDRITELRRYRPEVQHVDFVDDNFFVDRSRALSIAEAIAGVRPPVMFTCNGGRVRDLLRYDEAEIRLLAASGLDRIDIGVETGSMKIRTMIKKDETDEEIFEVCRRLTNAGISPWINLMAGFPGEDAEDLSRTIRLAMELTRRFPRLYVSPIYVYTPYPGTALYEELKKTGQKVPNYSDVVGTDWSRGVAFGNAAPHVRNLSRLYFYSLFVDDKVLQYKDNLWIRLALKLIKPAARLRVRFGLLRAPVGMWIVKYVSRGNL